MAKVNIDVNEVVSNAGRPTRPGSVTDTGVQQAQGPQGGQQAAAAAGKIERPEEPTAPREPERGEAAPERAAEPVAEERRREAQVRQEAREPERGEEEVEKRESGYEMRDAVPAAEPVAPVMADPSKQQPPAPSDDVEPIEIEGSEPKNELEPTADEAPIEVSEATAEMSESDPKRAVVPQAAATDSAPSPSTATASSFRADDVPMIEDMEIAVSDYVPAKRPKRSRRPARRFSEMGKAVVDSAKKKLGKRGRIGNTVGGMGTVDPDLAIDCVSVGTEEILFACEQPTSAIPQFLSAITGIPVDQVVDTALTRDPAMVDALIAAVNKAGVEVYTEKQPVTGAADQMALRLELHQGPGFRFHPLVAKAFNADFDGDSYKIVPGRDRLAGLPRPMDRVINVGSNPTIDEDFFLLKRRSDDRAESLEKMRGMVDFVFMSVPRGDSIRSDIANDLNDYLFESDKDRRAELWTILFRDIKKAARQTDARNVNRLTADFVKDLYDQNNFNLRIDMANKVLDGDYLDGYDYNPPEWSTVQSTTDTAKVVEWMQGVATDVEKWLRDPSTHRVPLNFQDFSNALGMSTEYHEGKNIQFRIAASFGKMIKLDDAMLVGSEYVVGADKLYDLFEPCADYMMTKIMSSRVYSGERQFILSAMLREKIIVANKGRMLLPSNFVMPNGNIDWNTFLNGAKRTNQDGTVEKLQDGFLERYEYFGGIADEADVKIATDFSITRGPQKQRGAYNRDRPTGSAKSVARWFLRTYGDFTMGRLFLGKMDPVSGTYQGASDSDVRKLLEPYAQMTLREWCTRQDGSIGSLPMINRVDENGQIVMRNGEPEKIEAPIRSTRDMLIALADLRRKASIEYQNTMEKAMDRAFDRIQELREVLYDYETKGKLDYMAFIDSTTEQLAMLHADMFAYYGMDSPENWLRSAWGREILSAQTGNELQSVFSKMVVNYRLGKARAVAKRYREVVSTDAVVKPNPENLRLRHEVEMWALKSSSPLWNLIAQDVQDGGAQFVSVANKVVEGLGKSGKDTVLVHGINMKMDYGADKWKSIGDRYSSMMQILKDDIGWEEKADLLCDCLKVYTGRAYTAKEMYWMLDQDPTSQYSGSIFAENDGYSKTMEQMKKASNRLGEETREKYDQIKADVKKARAKDPTGEKLSARLSEIKSDPSSLIQIDRYTYADALNSIMDKTFSDTEKSKQQEAVNAIHSALCYLRSGGLFSDLAVADDFLVGKIAYDRLIRTPTLIALILADERISIEVYDGRGSWTMSRSSLLENYMEDGDDVSSAMWRFLEDNPRIAQGLRRHRPVPGDNGMCSLTAMESLESSLDQSLAPSKEKVLDRAKGMLMDHPGLGCIVVAGVELSGRSSKKTRSPMANQIDNVVENLIKLSKMKSDKIEEYCKALVFDGPPEGKSSEEWEAKCRKIRSYIERYAVELKAAGVDQSGFISGSPSFSLKLSDPATYSSIDDVEQMLNGAKTENMTGVNGAETRRNGLMSFYAANKPGPCSTPPVEVSSSEVRENIERFRGWKTESGLFVTDEYLEELTRSETVRLYDPATCSCPLHCCSNHSVADGSADYRPSTQLTAMSLMMIIQRTDSTEKNNLKAKKSGWDGTDSITKFSVFDMLRGIGKIRSEFAEVEPTIRKKFREGDIAGARRDYAAVLQKNQKALGYDDLTISQYENIAHMLLVPTGDGDVRIMSAEQIAYIFNYGVDPAQVFDAEDSSDLVRIFDRAVASYGDPRGPAFDTAEMLAQVKVCGTSSRIRGVVRDRSSSLERTFSQIQRIKTRPLFREEIVAAYNRWTSQFPSEVRGFPNIVRYKDGEIQRYERRDHYDLLGVICEKQQNVSALQVSAGPASIWVVNPINVSEKVIADTLDKARRTGTNVAFRTDPRPMLVQLCLAQDAQNVIETAGPGNDKTYMIPFFDMLLNGADTVKPSTDFDIGLAWIPEDRVTRMAEDTQNEFRAGDSDGIAVEDFVKSSGVNKTGEYKVRPTDMFGPTFEEFYGTIDPWRWRDRNRKVYGQPTVNVATKAEQDWLSALSDEQLLTIVDLGVSQSDPRYEAMRDDFLSAMRQWRLTATSRESSPGVNVRPGHIVGFARCDIPGKPTVWAPIRPFRLDDGKGSPREFDVGQIKINTNTGEIFVPWSHRRSLLGSIFKFFEGRNPANKLIVRDRPAKGERKLRNGQSVSVYVGENSTRGRRMSNIRSDTMYTLMIEARCNPHGYNFAELEQSFPGRKDIQDAVRTGTATFSDWKSWMEEGIVFLDPAGGERNGKLNAWLRSQCQHALDMGVNPSFWIASRFENEAGERVPHNMVFRYDCMFDDSPAYQSNLQSFLNLMDERICPSEIGGDYSKCLFRNDSDGSLLMLVPHMDPDGRMYEVWEHVYSSYGFMDQHYSGITKPQIAGAKDSPSAMFTASYNGRIPSSKSEFRAMAEWSMADRAVSVAGPNAMYAE